MLIDPSTSGLSNGFISSYIYSTCIHKIKNIEYVEICVCDFIFFCALSFTGVINGDVVGMVGIDGSRPDVNPGI